MLEAINLDRIRFIGYAFQIEMKYTAWKLGFKIFEEPIIFTDRTEGQSKMSSGIFKEAILGVISLRMRNIKKIHKNNTSPPLPPLPLSKLERGLGGEVRKRNRVQT